MEKEIQAYKTAFSNQNEEINVNDEMDPKQIVEKLKFLYQMNKVELSETDEAKIITNLFLRDQKIYRYYRERLF